jgi:type I restriction enzyme R subunit
LPHIKEHTDPAKHERLIKSFKLAFEGEAEGVTGEVGIIIVNNMLLTGFDAPIEQVMYLDKVVKAHTLLQAIARVNRVADEAKDKGFVVDYVGIGHHLKEAIETYDEKEQQEILQAIGSEDEEFRELAACHREIMTFLEQLGLTNLGDYDAFFDLFYDEDLRFEYILLFKKLTRALNIVFPRKEALEFMKDYKALAAINVMASKHFRDERLGMKGIPEKLRKITDEYLQSKGIDQKVPPISIINPDFQNLVESRKRAKTKAAEIEHAIRHHIEINIDEDPELYASFAEAIDRILQEFKDNWNEIYKQLEELRKRIVAAGKEPTYGLHRKKQMPFFRILRKEIFGTGDLTEDQISRLVALTQDLYHLIDTEIRLTGFWQSIPARNRLKAEIQRILLSTDYINLPNVIQKRLQIISRIMELAEANQNTILYAA